MPVNDKSPELSSNIAGTGYRKRLRERFFKGGLSGFRDYEIIELLLSLGTPRRDCKQQAQEAVSIIPG